MAINSVLLLFAVSSQAAVVHWVVQSATFADGGVLSGTFDFDADAFYADAACVGQHQTNNDNCGFSAWNLTVTGGNTSQFPPLAYTSSTGSVYFNPSGSSEAAANIDFYGNDGRLLSLYLPTPSLTDAGGTIPILLQGEIAGRYTSSVECYNCNPYRLLTGGVLLGVRATESLTPAGIAAGFGLSTFADNFSSCCGAPYIGASGIVFTTQGVLVSSVNDGGVLLFQDENNQDAALAPEHFYGQYQVNGLGSLGRNYYLDLVGFDETLPGEVLQVNADGSFNRHVASIPIGSLLGGIAGDPSAGGLLVTAYNGGVFFVDPSTGNVTTLNATVAAFGVAVNAAGDAFLAFNDLGIVEGFDPSSNLIFNSGGIVGGGGAIGLTLGTGCLADDVFVSGNSGNIVEINIGTGAQTLIATGGLRGQAAAIDPYNGSLLFANQDSVFRLTGGGLGGLAPCTATTYGGTFNGNLTISSGLTYITNGTVTGNVTLNGGRLFTSNATIRGNLQITGGGTYSIASTTIDGSLQIQNIPAGSAQNQICGTNVKGNLQFHNNGTAVAIGTTSASCPGNTIGSNLQVNNNTAPVEVSDDTVDGNLQCQSNSLITGGETQLSRYKASVRPSRPPRCS